MPSDFLKGLKDAAKGAIDKVEGVIDKVGDAVEGVFRRDKEVVVYPTYAYRKQGDPGTWVVRLRVWVNKARRAPIPNQFVAAFTSEMGRLSEADVARLRERISAFVADDDSGETVSVSFDKDPDGRRYLLPGATDFNGLVMHELEIPDANAQAVRAAQGAVNGWLDFTVTAERFEGKGRARLVEPEGVSVISDIDDTIKITEVPAGKHIVLRNTFLRDYVPVEAMIGRYREYGDDVMFHYVSGSPWQLHKLLGEFVGGHFPEGAFHMKDVRKNLLVARQLARLRQILSGRRGHLRPEGRTDKPHPERLPESQVHTLRRLGRERPRGLLPDKARLPRAGHRNPHTRRGAREPQAAKTQPARLHEAARPARPRRHTRQRRERRHPRRRHGHGRRHTFQGLKLKD